MVTGSWAWAWWLVTDVQKMSLEVTMMIMMIDDSDSDDDDQVMTLNPVCDNVETKQGVPLTVTGVAQVRDMGQILSRLSLKLAVFARIISRLRS